MLEWLSLKYYLSQYSMVLGKLFSNKKFRTKFLLKSDLFYRIDIMKKFVFSYNILAGVIYLQFLPSNHMPKSILHTFNIP